MEKTQAFFTDRQFYRRDNNYDCNNRSNRSNPLYNRNRQKPRCFVCNKEGCRSWKYTKEKQEKSKTKFRNKFKNRFQERMKQYIIDYKGDDDEDNNKNNKITNTFNALVVDIDPSTLLDEDDQVTVYYTLYSEIELDNITAIALELANRVYSHAVTTINTTTNTFLTDTDPFAYNTALYYTSIKFIGIIIDTKTSKYSIVGYSQFLTL